MDVLDLIDHLERLLTDSECLALSSLKNQDYPIESAHLNQLAFLRGGLINLITDLQDISH
ncbi:hypothetical protein VIS19158_15656 [Vibrio scophthalmi LMG 19158]|uniref:Uncharacterized protein n=1 Tax=Vibrio scophthalmi LMG 19158 TaxID=870967 RepID=F9RK39_9VIBR|nr:hypothetical protein VIS19158_15656 [Vibrio scophthalmi LMG 19158]